MQVKKIVYLLDEDVTNIVNVGKLLKEISVGIAENSIDGLSDDTIKLLTALKEVVNTIITE